MSRLTSNPFLLLLLFLSSTLILRVTAEPAPTFCKCTCFTNSTIIHLGPHDASSPGSPDPNMPTGTETPSAARPDETVGLLRPRDSSSLYSIPTLDTPESHQPPSLQTRSTPRRRRSTSKSCTQCNRAFCLSYNLPICKGAEEKDVVTMCFQRDSTKDQVIVWLFILGTTGLLAWAVARRVMERQRGKSEAALSGAGGGGVGDAGRGAYRPVGELG